MLIATVYESDFPETMLAYIKYCSFPSYWVIKDSKATQCLGFFTQVFLKKMDILMEWAPLLNIKKNSADALIGNKNTSTSILCQTL